MKSNQLSVQALWLVHCRCIQNVINSPQEDKYRQLKLGSAAFQSKVGALDGSIHFLELCGFQKNNAGDALQMDSASVRPDLLTAAGSELNSALTNPFFGVL